MKEVTAQGYCIESSQLTKRGRKLLYQLYSDNKVDIANNHSIEYDGFDTNLYLVPHETAVCLDLDEQNILGLPSRYSLGVSVRSLGDLTHKCDFKVYLTEVNGNEVDAFYRVGSYIEFSDGHQFILPEYLYNLITAIEEHNENNRNNKLDRDELKANNYYLNGMLQELAGVNPLVLGDTLRRKEVIMPSTMTIQLVNNGDDTFRFEVHFNASSIDDDVNKSLYGRRGYGNPQKRYAFDVDQQKALRKMRKMSDKISKEEAFTIKSNPEIYFDTTLRSINLEYIGDLSDRVIGIGEFEYKPIYTDSMHNEWIAGGFASVGSTDGGFEKEISKDAAKVLKILDNSDESNLFEDSNYTKRPFISKELDILQPDITLKEYQKLGVTYLQDLWINGYKGALLADDMGLGKTLQTLTFLAWVHEQIRSCGSIPKPILVIAPVSLLQNWQDEYTHFINSTKGLGEPLILHGRELNKLQISEPPKQVLEKYDIPNVEELGKNKFLNTDTLHSYSLVITNYETVRDYQLSLALMDWSVIVLDEAQKIKEPSSRISQAIRGMNHDFGLALTGTPVENSWRDLWTIMDFCEPNKLGVLPDFNKEYIKPIADARGDFSVLLERGESLKQAIKPILLRRMKEDVLADLPKKEINSRPVIMTEYQWSQYLDVVENASEKTADSEHAFQIVQKLKSISLHPYLMYSKATLSKMSAKELIENSAKLKETISILDSIRERGEKVLIFAREKQLQDMLTSIIEERYNLELLPIINGDILGTRRQRIVHDFNHSNGFNVLILSAEAGGVGLNITSANHVIHLSREWNPAKEDQATDRVYRIGQNKTVYVYYPIAIGRDSSIATFDQVLDQLLNRKRELSKHVIVPNSINEEEGATLFESLLTPTRPCCKPQRITARELRQLGYEYIETILRKIFVKEGYTVHTKDLRSMIDVAYELDGQLRLLLVVDEERLRAVQLQCNEIFRYARNIYSNSGGQYTDYVNEICVVGGLNRDTVEKELIGFRGQIWNIDDVDDLLEQHNIVLSNI